jgi:CHC2 zinc finger
VGQCVQEFQRIAHCAVNLVFFCAFTFRRLGGRLRSAPAFFTNRLLLTKQTTTQAILYIRPPYYLNVPATPPNEFVRLIADYVKLEEGRKMLKGNCPFHQDTAGSFMVYPAKNIFKCFGCGLEGGATEFARAIAGL